MLFNSYTFIFLFLPLTALVCFILGHRGLYRLATVWLVLASLFFYGWWNPDYLALIILSILFNFSLGLILAKQARDGAPLIARRLTLTLGLAANLATLGYFKYANFFTDNINLALGTDYHLDTIILPLAISFFTFQQITYLVDSYQGKTREYDFVNYCLFISFFPQLIAGPIVHHAEMMPQFEKNRLRGLKSRDFAIGLTIFAIGLTKKAVFADGIAVYATPVFEAADAGQHVSFFEAWGGALSYTCQLYFDFSGYSDMAIGAARVFGIRLPLNFHSPYKAPNIIDFWRRWHMTLSRFLKDYVYIPLGGNRKGRTRRHLNLLATMLIGGLWHGASWSFVAWGGLHGAYLMVNHLWHHLAHRFAPLGRLADAWLWHRVSHLVTFLAVVVGWVFFRATTFDGALSILQGMVGFHGLVLPSAIGTVLGEERMVLEAFGVSFQPGGGGRFVSTWLWIAGLLAVAFLAPNSQQILRRYAPALNAEAVMKNDPPARRFAVSSGRLVWRPNRAYAVVTGVLIALGVLALPQVSEFLYFQF